MMNKINCPRCAVALEKRAIPERGIMIEVDVCRNCKGIWFDKGELERIEHVMELVMFEVRKIPKMKDQLTALNCPSCLEHPIMEKSEHHRDKKVIIDFCKTCQGIWLDKGELEAIQQEHWLAVLRDFFQKIK